MTTNIGVNICSKWSTSCSKCLNSCNNCSNTCIKCSNTYDNFLNIKSKQWTVAFPYKVGVKKVCLSIILHIVIFCSTFHIIIQHPPTTAKMSHTTKMKSFQLHIAFNFPIVVHITNSYVSTSRLDGIDGDIHLGLSDIHIFRNRSLDLWHLDFLLTLDIESRS